MVIANEKPTEKKRNTSEVNRSGQNRSRGLSHLLSKAGIQGIRRKVPLELRNSRNSLADTQREEANLPNCPCCNKPIARWAIKCRHCTSDVDWVSINELIPCRPHDKEALEKREMALMERPRVRSRMDIKRMDKENAKKELQLEKARLLLEEARLEKERREKVRLEKELQDWEKAREHFNLRRQKAQVELAKAKKLKDKEHFTAFLIAAGISCGSIVLVVIGRWLVT